jgi:MSHA biogenesis protein MshL
LNNRNIWAWLTMSAISLSSCAHQSAKVNLTPLDFGAELAADRAATATAGEAVDPVLSPSALTQDLLSFAAAPKSDHRIDIEAINRPAALFFADLGRSQEINIVVDPLVVGSISLSIRNVTLAQVIAALRDIYGYEFESTSYGYRVTPNQVSTRIYRLNYLNIERTGNSKTTVGGDDSNTVTTAFAANVGGTDGSFWDGIKRSVLGFIQSGDSDAVVINPQTGLLVITASSTEHGDITRFLADAELILQKQVIIEAKIVEVILDQNFRSGIDWSFFNGGDGSESGFSGDALTGVGGVGGIFNLSLQLDNFSSMLELLDHQGDVQVLSSPRVSTVNNQKAVIKVGTDEFFAIVTNVATGEEGTVTPAVELQQFFSGIALDVTPQIAADNSVTLHVRPTVTEVVERIKEISLGSEVYSLPVAYSNIRESDSIIRANSGQIIVIGGLLQRKQDLGSTGLPWLSNIPGLGWFFNQERRTQQKSELVILLKPTVYDQDTGMDDMDKVLDRLN